MAVFGSRDRRRNTRLNYFFWDYFVLGFAVDPEDPEILTIFSLRVDGILTDNFYLYFFLPRVEPPLSLLGAPVVGPRTGFTPTP